MPPTIRPAVPSLASLRSEQADPDFKAARERAMEAMVMTPAPVSGHRMTTAEYLCVYGISPPMGSLLVSRMAAAYDLEMCAEWGRRICPIPIQPPTARWKRELKRIWRAALPVLAGYGAAHILSALAIALLDR